MYWYYKVIFFAIIGAILYGVFSLVRPMLPDMPSFTSPDPIEEKVIVRALRYFVGNQIKVADFLGVNRNTLRKRIQEFGIDVAKLKEEVKRDKKQKVG